MYGPLIVKHTGRTLHLSSYRSVVTEILFPCQQMKKIHLCDLPTPSESN